MWCMVYGVYGNTVHRACMRDDRRTHFVHITSTLSILFRCLCLRLYLCIVAHDARSKTYPSLILEERLSHAVPRSSFIGMYASAFMWWWWLWWHWWCPYIRCSVSHYPVVSFLVINGCKVAAHTCANIVWVGVVYTVGCRYRVLEPFGRLKPKYRQVVE